MIDSTLQALCDMADIQRAVIEPMRANLVRVVDDVARRQRAVIEPMRANLVRVVDDVARRQRAVINRVVDDVARRQQADKLVERRPAWEPGMMMLRYRREPAVHPCRHEIRWSQLATTTPLRDPMVHQPPEPRPRRIGFAPWSPSGRSRR